MGGLIGYLDSTPSQPLEKVVYLPTRVVIFILFFKLTIESDMDVSVCLSVSVSLCLSVSVSLSLSVSLCVSLFLSLFPRSLH